MADAELRARKGAATSATSSTPATTTSAKGAGKQASDSAKAGGSIGVLDVLRVLGGLVLLSVALSKFVTGDSYIWGVTVPRYLRDKDAFVSKVVSPGDDKNHVTTGGLELTLEELEKYNGEDKELPIYIAIDGSIFDVSASPNFYGPGGGYHIFAGRDSTRAFVTGCFEADATADMRGVEEMFMPKDLDSPPKLPEDATEKDKKEAKRVWREKRQKAGRIGKLKVKQTVKHWKSMFESGVGGKYHQVGTVKREPGWEKNFGPIRTLCQRALDQRPETSDQILDEDEENVKIHDPRAQAAKGD